MVHLHCEANQRTLCGDAGRGGRRFVQHGGDFLPTLPELNASDDRLAILVTQLGEGRFVPLNRLLSDRPIERRRSVSRNVLSEVLTRWTPSRSADLVPDAIHHGLAKVRLERPFTPRPECPYVP
jgi:hypothetical protein